MCLLCGKKGMRVSMPLKYPNYFGIALTMNLSLAHQKKALVMGTR